MCISKKELEEKVQELRSLKTLKEETEDGIKAIEREIISYMKENETDTEITDTAKITYKEQSRTTLDKEKLTEILGDDLKPFEKTTSYRVLRVK
jgi:predicted phage-related endonuclease